VTLEPVDELNDVAGLHVYELAPLALSVVEPPAQIVALFTETAALLKTETVALVEFTHPLASVPVMMYCVVEDGVAVTLAPFEAVSDEAGLQVYELAPLAVRLADPPLHIVALATVIVGSEFTFTVVLAV
jgi:hypothetical protein